MSIVHRWTIKHFSSFYYTKPNYTALSFAQSNYFKSTSGETFFLRLHPKRPLELVGNFVSISLHLHANERLNVACKLAIIDFEGSECNPKENNQTLSTDNELDFKDFISKDDISEIEKGYLPEDMLTIICEITFLDQNNAPQESIPPTSETNARVHITRAQHRWQINKFPYYANERDVCLSSKDFSYSNDDPCKFFLRLWPQGRDEHSDEHLSLYVYLLTRESVRHQQITAQYKLSLLDSQLNEKHTKLNRHQIISGNEFGCHRYISLKKLLSKAELLPMDNLKINCVIDIIGDEILNQSLKPNNNKRKSTNHHLARLQSTDSSQVIRVSGSNIIVNVNSTANTGDNSFSQ